MFRAFGYRAAILHYGANTNGRSTPEQFKADMSVHEIIVQVLLIALPVALLSLLNDRGPRLDRDRIG